MIEFVSSYINSKNLSWEATTRKSESSRLIANCDMFKLGPDTAYVQLRDKLKPYSLKTLFIRFSDFEQWLIDNGHKIGRNEFRSFLKTNRNLFKDAYEKEKISVTFKEAYERIKRIRSSSIREKALQLLLSGTRWRESFTLDDNGTVLGKNRKRRKVFNCDRVEYQGTYHEFLSALRTDTGLKPHSLRKLFATELVNRGFSEADLMRVMGWSSMQTASSYVQSRKEDELAKELSKLVG